MKKNEKIVLAALGVGALIALYLLTRPQAQAPTTGQACPW